MGGHTRVMIRTFKSDETRKIFNQEGSRKLPFDIQVAALRKLNMLDAAIRLDVIAAIPGNRLEKLHGDVESRYSIRINDQWRICFTWDAADAYDVEIVDYH